MTLRRLHLPAFAAATAVTIWSAATLPGGISPPWWVALLLGAAAFLALGALEPALVALLSAGAGVLWAARLEVALDVAAPTKGPLAAWTLGVLAALLLARARLAPLRGRDARPSMRALLSLLALASGLSLSGLAWGPRWIPFFLLPPLAVLLLAPALMDVLLFKDHRRGAPRLVWILGALLGFLHILLAQLLLLLAALPVRLLPGDPAARLRRLGRLGPTTLFRLFPYGRLDRSGIDVAAFARPAIVVSNHQSAADILLVLALPGDIRLTLSPRVWRTPTLGIAARSLGHILVEPDNVSGTLETCARRLREGASVHFFPEGTRSEDAFPARFHLGAFEVAVALGSDILPVVLCDTRGCIPRDAFWVERFHMSVKALPRVTPATFDYGRGAGALRKHVQESVRAAFLEEHARIHTPQVLRRKVARRYRYQGLATGIAVRRALARDRWMDRLGDVLPASGRVLDLGCGLGLASHWLAEVHPRLQVVGVDADGDRIRVATRSATGSPRVTFRCGPVEEAEGPADGAVLRAAAKDLGSALRRVFSALAPGAPLFLPDLRKEEQGAVAAAGFVPAEGRAQVYVRGGESA